MSEYIACETKIKDADCLVAALKEMGVKSVSVHEVPVRLRGYNQEQKAHVVGRIPELSHEFGFEKQSDGTFRLWLYDYDAQTNWGRVLAGRKLCQQYAKQKVLKTVQKDFKGSKVTKNTVEKDGRIKIRVELA